MLNTIHVTLTINGNSVKRPLRVYDARDNTFGVVIKGEVHKVQATGATTVALVKGLPKHKDSCRAARLADLGITAKPLPEFIKARKGNKPTHATPATQHPAPAISPEALALIIEVLKTNGVKFAA
jgi:hypothetical protein